MIALVHDEQFLQFQQKKLLELRQILRTFGIGDSGMTYSRGLKTERENFRRYRSTGVIIEHGFTQRSPDSDWDVWLEIATHDAKDRETSFVRFAFTHFPNFGVSEWVLTYANENGGHPALSRILDFYPPNGVTLPQATVYKYILQLLCWFLVRVEPEKAFLLQSN